MINPSKSQVHLRFCKFLGMIFDPQLKFYQHIAYITKSLSKAIGIMAKLHHYLPKNVLIDVYHALFHSHLLHGILT